MSDQRLADVHELGGAFADHVNAEQLARFAVKQQLEHAARVADQLTARALAITGHAGLVRHATIAAE